MALAKVDITTQAVGIVVPERNITKLGTMVTGAVIREKESEYQRNLDNLTGEIPKIES